MTPSGAVTFFASAKMANPIKFSFVTGDWFEDKVTLPRFSFSIFDVGAQKEGRDV